MGKPRHLIQHPCLLSLRTAHPRKWRSSPACPATPRPTSSLARGTRSQVRCHQRSARPTPVLPHPPGAESAAAFAKETFGDTAGLLVAAAAGKLSADTDAPRKREATVLDADGAAHRFVVAALPTACSRHNTPARSDAVSTVLCRESLDCARRPDPTPFPRLTYSATQSPPPCWCRSPMRSTFTRAPSPWRGPFRRSGAGSRDRVQPLSQAQSAHLTRR